MERKKKQKTKIRAGNNETEINYYIKSLNLRASSSKSKTIFIDVWLNKQKRDY